MTAPPLALTIRTAARNSTSNAGAGFMIPRGLLISLVFGLPILAVTFGVVVGAATLAGGLGDAAGARGLFWVAIAALVLLVIDALLLLIVLGLRAVVQDELSQSEAEERIS